MSVRRLAFALVACAPLACGAAAFDAVVSRVVDGDTVWVRPIAGGPPEQVRIEGIDAPEICQAFGQRSRDALAARVLHKRVTLTPGSKDDFRRTVARLRAGPDDIGGWMVAQGHAWSYRFRGDPGPYAAQERRAREARRGLWSAPSAQRPRDFRLRHGACSPPP